MTHMMSGRELDEAALPATGYCQYCGIAGAHVEFWRFEIEPIDAGRVRGRMRVFYACGHEHLQSTVREEAVAELRELLDAHSVASN